MVAAPEPVAQPLPHGGVTPHLCRQPPLAQLRNVPRRSAAHSEETGPDISRADFVWCMTAITWGWSMQETAERLMEESTKAQANDKAYAELTARNAALPVERRKLQPQRYRIS